MVNFPEEEEVEGNGWCCRYEQRNGLGVRGGGVDGGPVVFQEERRRQVGVAERDPSNVFHSTPATAPFFFFSIVVILLINSRAWTEVLFELVCVCVCGRPFSRFLE